MTATPPTSAALSARAAVADPSVIDNVHPALRSWFHPVCRSGEVLEGQLVKVTLLGEDWVVTRIDGRLHALVDRCAHRYAPLSAGCVVDDTVQCPYHGYRYDTSGRCVLIPALGADASIPPKAAVQVAAAVEERYGLVWLAPDEPRVGIIDVPEWDDPSFVVAPLPDQTWSAGAAQMVDNFLDLAHFPFTHTETFGDPDDVTVPSYTVERDGWGFTCDYRHSTKVLADSMGVDGAGSGQFESRQFEVEERRSTWWFLAPFAIRLRIHYPVENVVLTILFFHQPVDAVTTKLYCFDLRDDIADGRSTIEDTVAFQVAVATEDRHLLEQFPDKSVPLDTTAEVHTRADRITLEMRRVLADLVAAG